MDNRVELMRLKYGLQRGMVAYIHIIAEHGFTRNGFQPLQHTLAGVVKIIGNYGFMAGVYKLHIGMRANKARAARQKDLHKKPPYLNSAIKTAYRDRCPFHAFF